MIHLGPAGLGLVMIMMMRMMMMIGLPKPLYLENKNYTKAQNGSVLSLSTDRTRSPHSQ